MSDSALTAAGLFAVGPVATLWKKCLTRSSDEQFSNSDNMAVVGILSAQLVHQQLIREAPSTKRPVLKTVVERH
jgi:asparagine synthase (glutamine-hydrolysing)